MVCIPDKNQRIIFFHVSTTVTWSKSMKQCQLSERYRCGGTKKEIKMPYNSDTSSWYSK